MDPTQHLYGNLPSDVEKIARDVVLQNDAENFLDGLRMQIGSLNENVEKRLFLPRIRKRWFNFLGQLMGKKVWKT